MIERQYDVRCEHVLAFEDGRHFQLSIDAVVLEGEPRTYASPGVCHEVVRWTVLYQGHDITKGIDRSRAGLLVAPLEQTVLEEFEAAGEYDGGE